MANVPARADAVRAASAPAVAVRVGGFRWVVCALLFLAATINYVDRQVVSLL